MDKNLYHVNSSKNNVGGGSLGARKTTFYSAYAGRDSIHNTIMEVSPGPQCQQTTEEDQISVYLFEFSLDGLVVHNKGSVPVIKESLITGTLPFDSKTWFASYLFYLEQNYTTQLFYTYLIFILYYGNMQCRLYILSLLYLGWKLIISCSVLLWQLIDNYLRLFRWQFR